MRAFVSIDIDDAATLASLGTACTELGAKSFQHHITLSFLGEIDDAMSRSISDKMSLLEFDSFEIEICGLGSFGSGARRIVWAGVREGRDELSTLVSKLDLAISPLGFSRDRGFTPHITISRKSASTADVLAKYRNTVFGVQRICGVSLKRSDYQGARHEHTTIHTVRATS